MILRARAFLSAPQRHEPWHPASGWARFLRSLLPTAFLVCLPLSAAYAQPVAYGVFGAGQQRFPSVTESAIQGAGGFEIQRMGRFVTVGGELGYFTPTRNLSAGVGVLGVHALLHLQPENSIRPFAGLGYARLFRNSSANAVTWFVGADVWSSDRFGLRIDLRDHVQRGSLGAVNHYWSIRAGILVR